MSCQLLQADIGADSSTAMPAINFQLDRVPHARRVPQKYIHSGCYNDSLQKLLRPFFRKKRSLVYSWSESRPRCETIPLRSLYVYIRLSDNRLLVTLLSNLRLYRGSTCPQAGEMPSSFLLQDVYFKHRSTCSHPKRGIITCESYLS